jgi:hypothetical protein
MSGGRRDFGKVSGGRSRVAQSAERPAVNRQVTGSSPVAGARSAGQRLASIVTQDRVITNSSFTRRRRASCNRRVAASRSVPARSTVRRVSWTVLPRASEREQDMRPVPRRATGSGARDAFDRARSAVEARARAGHGKGRCCPSLVGQPCAGSSCPDNVGQVSLAPPTSTPRRPTPSASACRPRAGGTATRSRPSGTPGRRPRKS